MTLLEIKMKKKLLGGWKLITFHFRNGGELELQEEIAHALASLWLAFHNKKNRSTRKMGKRKK